MAGDNVTVTGSGSVANPYVVSANGFALQVVDTPNIDLTLTGTGSTLDPYVLTATPNYVAGAGVAPIDADGIIEVCTSTDPGNALTFGADGCLFVPAGSGNLFADTNSVDLTLTGTTVTADVIRDPSAQNLLTIGPAGVLVDLVTGCGLSGVGTAASPLVVPSVAWPWACPETNGADVYCDPATGMLVTDPKQDRRVLEAQLTSVNGSMELNAIGVPIGGPPAVFGPTINGTFTNPNPCRDMVVIVNGGVKHFNLRVDSGGRTQFQYGAQLTLTGVAAGVYTPNGAHVQFMFDDKDPDSDYIADTVATTQIAQFILPAGASFNYTLQGIAQLTNYNGDSQVGTLQVFAHFDGQTI